MLQAISVEENGTLAGEEIAPDEAPGTVPRTALECLSKIATHHGVDLPVERLLHGYALDGTPVSASLLLRMAKDAGLRAQSIRIDWSALFRLGGAYSRTIGSVVKEAETLFALVPRDLPLQAEVYVECRDIGQVSVGQPLRIKFEAFPFQKYGTGTGVVRVISQDSFSPDPKAAEGAHHATAPYYRVLVDLTDTRLRVPQERDQLISGMAVTAELKVGRRSVMSYFLYPLLRGLDESIREY